MDHAVCATGDLAVLTLHAVVEVVNIAHAIRNDQVVLFLQLHHLSD